MYRRVGAGFLYVIKVCNCYSYIYVYLHISQFIFGLFLQTMMVWLWGVNLWVFAQSSVNCAKIFDLDNNHLTHRETWKVFWNAVDGLLSCYAFIFSLRHLTFVDPKNFLDFISCHLGCDGLHA